MHKEIISFPKNIAFSSTSPTGFTKGAQDWLARIRNEVKITMPDENTLKVEYPTDIVKEVGVVNVDDSVVRLDLIDPGNSYYLCHCVFPDIPWNNRYFMQNRWLKKVREDKEGEMMLTIPIC